MVKPRALHAGDKVAVVSLSSGMGGEELFRYRYETGKKRLEEEFGLRVHPMPNALRGVDYLDRNPNARAEDLLAAFADPEIHGIICMVGGDDAVRLLPFIDYSLIRDNPKIFMGYSDTTVNHFMLYKAGLVSFHGPCVLAEFAENVEMHSYTKEYIRRTLFQPEKRLDIPPSPHWTSEFLDWAEPSNQAIRRAMTGDSRGFELLQGTGVVSGRLLGGCLSVFPMFMGTEIWPTKEDWKDTLLFLETAEDYPTPDTVKYLLRGLVAQGIVENINGIVVGKPLGERYFEEYKEVYHQVIAQEAGRPELPILYNVNFGHNAPTCILPYGIRAEIDCKKRSFALTESAVLPCEN